MTDDDGAGSAQSLLLRGNVIVQAAAPQSLMHGQPVRGDVLWTLLASAVIVLVASPIAMRLYRKER